MFYGAFLRTPPANLQDPFRRFQQAIDLHPFFPIDFDSRENGRLFLAQGDIDGNPFKPEHGRSLQVDGSDCIIGFWGRLYNRDELISRLQPGLADLSDPDLVLLGWLRWRKRVVDHLVGEFVFVIYEPGTQNLFCARDHLGSRPFYFQLTEHQCYFSTSLLALQQSGCCDLSLDRQWLAQRLMLLSPSFSRTPYQHIAKLAPGHWLLITPEQSEMHAYFRFSAESSLQLKHSEEYVEAYRYQLQEAIGCRLTQDHPQATVGCDLSGGLDSSTLACFASDLLDAPGKQLHSFSYLNFDQDEKYIHSVRQQAKIGHSHIIERISESPAAYDWTLFRKGYPTDFADGSSRLGLYQKAQSLGIRVMLSGFGGDNFVTTRSDLTLRELFHQGEYLRILDSIRGNNLFLRGLRLLKFILTHSGSAMNARKPHPGLFATHSARWHSRILQDRWLSRYALQERLFENTYLDKGYTNLNEYTLEKRWTPKITIELENSALIGAAYQLEYRYPLLDIRLLKLFLSIPAGEKYYRGIDRWLHRRAIDSIVPNDITWKLSKGTGDRLPANHVQLLPPPATDQLHPILEELVDKKRLERSRCFLHRPVHKDPIHSRAALRQLDALAKLDRWLKLQGY